ncbi:MAG TPA: ABC transporter ATP-binding protein [Caulobacteraceae bacterium]|jgi:ATP-binding cassette subfamily B protein
MTDAAEQDGQGREVLSNGQVLAFIVRQWMRRPRWFVLSAGLMLIAVCCDLTAPWMADGLVTAVSHAPEAGTDQAWRAWAAFSGIYVALYAIRNVAFVTWNPFAARNMEGLITDAFARVQSFSADWHADTFAGATVRRVGRAMWGYDSVSDQLVLWLGPSTLVLFGLAVSMLLHWPVVGAFVLVMVLAYMGLSLALAKFWIRPANLKAAALDSEIGANLADSITSNATVKAFGAERREAARFAGVAKAWREAAVRSWNRAVLTGGMLNALMVLLQAGLTGLLVLMWSRHQAQAGDVAFAITSFLLMSGYLRNFGENVRNLQKGLDDTEAVAGYMRTEPQVADPPSASAFRRGQGEIVFDRVTFQYKGQGEPLYERFTLAIRAGERVALVGPTGSGKSTFVKLIQRLYDLQDGQIRIDGQDVASVTQESLRQALAVVPQDPALFHRSIAENIAYGKPDATHEEIVAAARRAKAHGFISRLPKGYDTLVGERGIKLSGGERQRVAIARAFLTGAPIVVFDEATSSLDVETERDVQLAAEALMKGRTTIVIAHRLSTIRDADRILVFCDGRVVEEGRHGELVEKQGAYARLHAVAEGAVI